MAGIHKLSVRVPRAQGAAWAAAMERWVAPEPAAVTSFADAEMGIWQVEAYFEDEVSEADIADLVRQISNAAAAGTTQSWRFGPVADEDWAAKVQRELVPVRAGRFVVHGSHDRARVRPCRWAIEIEAGEAFGTAHHDTTRGCLEAIDRLARTRRCARIADVGCGTGILAIAAAKAWPQADILASDSDPTSVRIARENARLNRVGEKIRAVTAAGLAHPALRARAPYDLLLANILAEPLIALAPTLTRAVRPRGVLVLSGLLVEQTREVLGAYRALGLACRERRRRGEWMTLLLS